MVMTAHRAATGTAAFALGRMPCRCGSYPLMNLAEDFGVDYGDVLLLSTAAGPGVYVALPEGRRRTVEQASRRIWTQLGEGTSNALYARLKVVLGR